MDIMDDFMDVSAIMKDLVKRNQAYWESQMSQTHLLQYKREKRRCVSYEDFVYVVEREEQSRICFLSGQERYPLSKKVVVTPEFMGPDTNGIVQRITEKVRSNRGVGGLADLQTRFKDLIPSTDDPFKYDPHPPKPVKETPFPFGKSLKVPKKILNRNPGPGYYETPKKCRRPRKIYCKRGMDIVPCVEIRCVPKAADQCFICQQICDADYWHFDYTTFLCLQCMRNERRMKTKFKLSELNRFKKIRNCSFAHQHEGTTASVYLRTKAQLQTKYRIENYLDSYFNKYV